MRRGDDVRALGGTCSLPGHADPEQQPAPARAATIGADDDPGGQTTVGQPSWRCPLGRSRRNRSTISATTSSTERSGRVDHDRVVGRRSAATRPGPSRARRGGRATPAPRRPRRRRSAAASSRWRRRARSSSLAVRNTFTGASGNTTVPMSRPSTTPPPCSLDPRPLAGDELRRAPRDGPRRSTPRAVTSGPRISALTSRPSSRTTLASSSIVAARGRAGAARRRRRGRPRRRARRA